LYGGWQTIGTGTLAARQVSAIRATRQARKFETPK